MNDHQPWEFTCKNCGDHNLTDTHVWSILAGPRSESWQEWGQFEEDHLGCCEFKEKIEQDKDEQGEVKRGDFGEFAEDDSVSKPEEYEKLEQESDPESDEFYVNCTSCDREIEFGWVSPWHYGLNQGPVILMIENYRTGLLWRLMRDCPYIVNGLQQADFEGIGYEPCNAKLKEIL